MFATSACVRATQYFLIFFMCAISVFLQPGIGNRKYPQSKINYRIRKCGSMTVLRTPGGASGEDPCPHPPSRAGDHGRPSVSRPPGDVERTSTPPGRPHLASVR